MKKKFDQIRQGGTVARSSLEAVDAKNAIISDGSSSGSAPSTHGASYREEIKRKFGDGERGSSLTQKFNRATHDTSLSGIDYANLLHPRDLISHGIDRHDPNSKFSGKTLFDNHAVVHQARKAWHAQYGSEMQKSSENRFFKVVEFNGQKFKFGYEYSNEKWREITGYPTKREKD
jgi:hypothetical protein